jgi:adenylate cyclase
VVGEATRALADDYAMLEIDLIRVKGKTIPVRIYTLVGDPAVQASEDFKVLEEQHIEFIALYRAQKWDECDARLPRLREMAAKYEIAPLYDTYEERILEYRADPLPADWDGVYVATSK